MVVTMKPTDKGRKPPRANLFIRLALLAFFLFGVIMVASQQLEYLSLDEKAAGYEKQIVALEEDIGEINDKLSQPYDDGYIERSARSLLGYHMPDEILYYSSLLK